MIQILERGSADFCQTVPGWIWKEKDDFWQKEKQKKVKALRHKAREMKYSYSHQIYSASSWNISCIMQSLSQESIG